MGLFWDYLEGVILLTLGMSGLVEGFLIEKGLRSGGTVERFGPGSYLMLVSAGLLVAGVAGLVARARSAGRGKGFKPGPLAVSVATATMGYVLVAPFAGYQVATALFFVAAFKMLGMRSWLRVVLVSLALAIAFHLVFVVFGGIILPMGWLDGLL